jgi:hypothetical protein
MVLEVVVENHAAIALYEQLGFVRTRELEVLSLTPGTTRGRAADAPLDAVRQLIRTRRESDEPWQRADATLDRLVRREPAPTGIVAGDSAAIYRLAGDTVSLLQAAGDEPGLLRILAALRARGTVSAVNYPADGTVARALRAAGARVPLRQFEMVKRLS